jgi:uncharacterized protein (UPF0276 family)
VTTPAVPPARRPGPIPARAGVGLKPEHAPDILDGEHAVAWFEIHAENYMGAGGPPHRFLTRVRERWPLSAHGVGLSIGGAGPLDKAHLARLKTIVERYEPGLISEHLAWSTHDSAYLNDLLPLPYTRETLRQIADHVDEVQETLGRRMLLENPSTYVIFVESSWAETDFLAEIACRTGCGLLLDINNVFISATNHCLAPEDYLGAFPLHLVGEIHLAGYAVERDGTKTEFLIDTHDRPVADPVWDLYRDTIARAGPLPTLIEWDAHVPAFSVLASEARRAEAVMAGFRAEGAHAAA